MSTPPAHPTLAEADQLVRLLHRIARDVAHDLRGPVQSALVNLEVVRRLAGSDGAQFDERANIVEQEIRRMHAMTDAFLSLLRPAEPQPRAVTVDALFAAVDALATVIARNARVGFRREGPSPDILLRIRPEPARLALIAAIAHLVDAGRPGDIVEASATHSAADVLVRLDLRPAAVVPGEAEVARAGEPLRAARAWLHEAGGTADPDPGSDAGVPSFAARLPRGTA